MVLNSQAGLLLFYFFVRTAYPKIQKLENI